jgi:hypothetical protein
MTAENRLAAVKAPTPALRARRAVMTWAHRRRMAPVHADLERRHGDQRPAWKSRSEGFSAVMELVGPQLEREFLQSDWAANQQRLEDDLLPVPPFEFLSTTTLTDTMVMVNGGKPFKRELRICRDLWGAGGLAGLAEEDLAGDPVLHAHYPLTSHTRVHHLHSLARYEQARGPGLRYAAVVLEWGAGFGGMARVLRRLAVPGQTQILVDLPIMCALQWLYLGVTLGPDAVHLVGRAGDGIAAGRVNIVTHGMLDEIDLAPDAFVSTWALGESEVAAHRFCQERGWLDAPLLLIADQKSGFETRNSDRLLELVEQPGTGFEPVGTVPGSCFAFR